MILSKLWHDLRWRFVFCCVFALLNILLLIFLFPIAKPALLWIKADISVREWAQINPLLSSYQIFMDHGWFQEAPKFSMFAIILALGGIMTERKNHTALFSLSLPVSRRDWVLYQAAFVFGLLIVICCLASVVLLIGGFIYGTGYPIGRIILGTSLLALLTLPWIGLTLAVTSVMQDKMKTAILIFGVWILMGVLQRLQDVRVWLPRQVLLYFNGEPLSWQPLVVIVVVGIGGILFAVRQFEAQDY